MATGISIECILGRAVAERRRLLKVTQEQLAERVGVAVETISRLERGTATPSIVRADQVAHALGTDLARLLQPPTRRTGLKQRALARLEASLRERSVRDLEMIADVVERILRG